MLVELLQEVETDSDAVRRLLDEGVRTAVVTSSTSAEKVMNAAGIRTEPRVSVPREAHPRPAATAAAEPPDEPPVM